jgi:hypothetical protein
MNPGASDTATFARRVVVFMEASPEEIDKARSGVSAADFAVIADDLMFYRAAAYEYLEKKRLHVVRLVGRRPLTFVVDGRTRQYNFLDFPTLDVIVLFDPVGEPRPIAPVDVHVADEYFGSQPPR